jgi:exonuclease III
MTYSGAPREEWASSGVAILVRKERKNRIIDYKWISPRIMQLRLKMLTYIVKIIGIYAPVEGKTTETEEFYDEVQAAVDKTINRTTSFWPEILKLQLGINQMVNKSDQRVNKQSATMDETEQTSASLINSRSQTHSSDIRIYTSSHGKQGASNLWHHH